MTLSNKNTRWLVGALVPPTVALLVASWGSVVGWNVDGRFGSMVITYAAAAYALFFLPMLFLAVGASRVLPRSVLATTAKPGYAQFFRGAYAMLASVALIQAFDSTALWLGSMGSFYLGFILVIYAVVKAVG